MESLRTTEALHVAGFALIVVQRVHLEARRTWGVPCIMAHASPQAILVGERGSWWALGMDGRRAAIEPLLEEVEGLAEILACT